MSSSSDEDPYNEEEKIKELKTRLLEWEGDFLRDDELSNYLELKYVKALRKILHFLESDKIDGNSISDIKKGQAFIKSLKADYERNKKLAESRRKTEELAAQSSGNPINISDSDDELEVMREPIAWKMPRRISTPKMRDFCSLKGMKDYVSEPRVCIQPQLQPQPQVIPQVLRQPPPILIPPPQVRFQPALSPMSVYANPPFISPGHYQHAAHYQGFQGAAMNQQFMNLSFYANQQPPFMMGNPIYQPPPANMTNAIPMQISPINSTDFLGNSSINSSANSNTQPNNFQQRDPRVRAQIARQQNVGAVEQGPMSHHNEFFDQQNDLQAYGNSNTRARQTYGEYRRQQEAQRRETENTSAGDSRDQNRPNSRQSTNTSEESNVNSIGRRRISRFDQSSSTRSHAVPQLNRNEPENRIPRAAEASSSVPLNRSANEQPKASTNTTSNSEKPSNNNRIPKVNKPDRSQVAKQPIKLVPQQPKTTQAKRPSLSSNSVESPSKRFCPAASEAIQSTNSSTSKKALSTNQRKPEAVPRENSNSRPSDHVTSQPSESPRIPTATLQQCPRNEGSLIPPSSRISPKTSKQSLKSPAKTQSDKFKAPAADFARPTVPSDPRSNEDSIQRESIDLGCLPLIDHIKEEPSANSSFDSDEDINSDDETDKEEEPEEPEPEKPSEARIESEIRLNHEPLIIKKEVDEEDEQEEDRQRLIRLRPLSELMASDFQLPNTPLGWNSPARDDSGSSSPNHNEPESDIDDERNWELPGELVDSPDCQSGLPNSQASGGYSDDEDYVPLAYEPRNGPPPNVFDSDDFNNGDQF